MAVASRLPSKLRPALAARCLSSVTLSGGKASSVGPAVVGCTPSSSIDLEDTGRLFESVPTGALLRSLAVLQAMAVGPLVDVGSAVMRSEAVIGSRLGRAAVRATVHRQFCAGEGPDEVGRTVRAMWEGKGLRGILDYGMEDAEDADACGRNVAGFLRTVETAASLPPDSVSVCIKITALCPISLLERISNLLRWEHKDAAFDLPWRSHSFPVLSAGSPLYFTPSAPDPLTPAEEAELLRVHGRLSDICQRCADAGIPLLIDAEYASVQPAIDYFTYAAALRFNRGERPVVFGTLQAYLRDASGRLAGAVEAAEREGIQFGVKLVRGAYMSREARVAASLGAPSPVHRSIEETHECYNSCALFLLERARRGSAALVLATHNLESGKLAVAKAEELGLRKESERLQFAQLMGMAEGLSLGLRNAGFQVSKYLPFGPVQQVVPYLLRRAEENRGFLSTATLDRQLIRKELMRRAAAAFVGKSRA